MRDGPDFQERMARVEGLVEDLERLADPALRDRARELVRTLLDLYGTGLAKIVNCVSRTGDTGRALLESLAQDSLVGSLLHMHGLHPVNLRERVLQALAKARPFFLEHGIDMELLDATNDTVRLRLDGVARVPALPLKVILEDALLEAAPEITTLEIEGLEDPTTFSKSKVIPLQLIEMRD